MKKTVSFLLITAMLFALIPFSAFSAFAAESEITDSQGVVYTLNTIGQYLYIVSGCDKSATRVAIPAKINGVTVGSIDSSAFLNCTSLKSVIIPGSVYNIDRYAFRGCTALESVSIAEGVTNIYDGAFYGCTSLKSIVIPEGVERIGLSAFFGCSALKSIVIPASVTDMGNFAFADCTSLASIAIPAGVKAIGENAFRNCASLKSADIPEGVTSIGNFAFYGCKNLAGVVIPKSVKSIGDSAFCACKSLETAIIPEGVTSIGGMAFAGCTSLNSIVIPESVMSIGSESFSGWTGEQTIYFRAGSQPGSWDKNWAFNCKANTVWNYRNAFDIVINMPEYYIPGDVIEAEVKLGNNTVEQLSAINFDFCYDPAQLELLNAIASDNTVDCATKLPGKNWENLTILDNKTPGKIIVAFILAVEDSFPENDGDITLTFRFKVRDNAQGAIGARVPGDTVLGYDWNDPTKELSGSGSSDFSVLHEHSYTLEKCDSEQHKYVCSCGKITYEKHDFSSVVIAPDCENGGCTVKTCKLCGEVVTTDVTSALGHKPGDWVTVKEAINGEDGLKEKHCTVCGKTTESEVIPGYVKGDINGNGRIDSSDYALAKRHVLRTFTLTGNSFKAADLNGDGMITAQEYGLIKRHVLGSYVIK